jgi:hypothetical protein
LTNSERLNVEESYRPDKTIVELAYGLERAETKNGHVRIECNRLILLEPISGLEPETY